jgi:hypothetical protein
MAVILSRIVGTCAASRSNFLTRRRIEIQALPPGELLFVKQEILGLVGIDLGDAMDGVVVEHVRLDRQASRFAYCFSASSSKPSIMEPINGSAPIGCQLTVDRDFFGTGLPPWVQPV